MDSVEKIKAEIKRLRKMYTPVLKGLDAWSEGYCDALNDLSSFIDSLDKLKRNQ